ncbi:hypothetical protein JCM8208_003259 [Rhodotorula glutinis]
MDSYPNEFTAHHHPLLFVAGLAPPPSSSHNTSDPFTLLQHDLARTLASPRSFPLWDSSRATATPGATSFHAVLVDKNLRFPPLKARPATSSAQQPAPTAPSSTAALHSPISPLTPTSPLYPDGLIAPIWVRKHRELVPAVFVLVLRLHESAPGSNRSPDDRLDEERQADIDLVRDIVDRRRTTLERGTKLAVVLLCSRELLDDPALDLRLSLIRRQSGLDSRASLFVISPVPHAEVANFCASLEQELYPAALDYYREHGRRVRRKRTRQAPPGAALSDRGWTVRYDYKLALFAEMRSEIEVSLKHYEDCYDALVDLFAQPDLLGARTKRWAEAKVLADCVSIKVSKMYLYLNEPARALAQLNRHVSRFRELSGSWQIGDDTFEFWSWLSKQYRLFGDLVALALRAGFRLPSLRPPPTPRLPAPSSTGLTPSQIPSPGLVPLNVLQHAGHYYHLAAVCAVARRDRYREAVRAVEVATEAAAGQEGGGAAVVSSPALAHERKVDHSEIIVELLTKAYEFFKAHRAKNMTYCVANEIALAHLEAGKADMALKFYDRIAKSYRRDGWRDILDSILERTFRAAVLCDEWDAAVRAGFELLAPSSKIAVAQREQYAQELLEILETRAPPPGKARVQLDTADIAPLLDCHLTFLRPSAHAAEPVPFQLVLAAPIGARTAHLAFAHLDLHLNDGRPPVRISHDEDAPSSTSVGHVGSAQERRARLRWSEGETRVFTGKQWVDMELELTVDKVVLVAEIGGWTVELGLPPQRAAGGAEESVWYVGEKRVPLLHGGSTCRITRRDLKVHVETECASPAYLDERFPVHVDVKNEDDLEVNVSLVVFLQPGEEGSYDRILVDDLASTSLIDSLPLGTLAPGASLRKTFYLETLGGLPGPRNLDVTVHAVPVPPTSSALTSSSSAALPLLPNSTDCTRSLSLLAIRPVHASFDTHVPKRRRDVKPLLDLDEPHGWEGASDAMVITGLSVAGPWDVEVARVQLRAEDAPSVRVVASSLGYLAGEIREEVEAMTWRPGDQFHAVFSLEVQPDYGQLLDSHLYLDIEWRRSGSADALSHTRLRLAAPRPLPLVPTVTLRLPPFLTLQESTTLIYRLSNPTGRLVTLSSQLDSPETPSTFAFAGARRLPEWVLGPSETRELHVRVVPLAAGHWALPRLRVWRVERPPPAPLGRVDDNGYAPPPPPPQAPRLHELEVEVEGEAVVERDAAQVELEADLRSARGPDEEGEAGVGGVKAPVGRAPVVLVLPR